MDESIIDTRQIEAIVDWLLEYYTGRPRAERIRLIGYAAIYWRSCESRLNRCKKLSCREAMNVIAETVIEETRAQQLDLLARAKFAHDGDTIHETRSIVEDLLNDEVSEYKSESHSGSLQGMADFDWIEVG